MSSPYEAYLREMIERLRGALRRVEAEVERGRDGKRRRMLESLRGQLTIYEGELLNYRRGLQHLRGAAGGMER